MNAGYLKQDFKWDFSYYMGRIFHESEKMSSTIKKFVDFSEQLKRENSKIGEGGEVIIEVNDMPDELTEGLTELIENLQNEVFYNSLLVMTFSFTEFSMAELCRMLHPYISKPILPYYKYKNENGIDKSKNYLYDAFDIKISDSKHWSKLQEAKKLRNLIIHNSGNLMVDYDKKLEEQPDYKLFQAIKMLDITETGFVFIRNVDYIHSTLEISLKFIHEINEGIQTAVKKGSASPTATVS